MIRSLHGPQTETGILKVMPPGDPMLAVSWGLELLSQWVTVAYTWELYGSVHTVA